MSRQKLNIYLNKMNLSMFFAIHKQKNLQGKKIMYNFAHEKKGR